jgi:hypothetical protein
MGNRCQPRGRGHGRFHRTSMCITLEYPRHNLSSSPVRRSINDRYRYSDRPEESCGKDPVEHGAEGVRHSTGAASKPRLLDLWIHAISALIGTVAADHEVNDSEGTVSGGVPRYAGL